MQANKISDGDLVGVAGGHVISGEETVNLGKKVVQHNFDPSFFEMVKDDVEKELEEQYEKRKNKWYIINDQTGQPLEGDKEYATKEEAIAADKVLNKNSRDKKWYSLRKTRVLSADDYLKKYGYPDSL